MDKVKELKAELFDLNIQLNTINQLIQLKMNELNVAIKESKEAKDAKCKDTE